jgi:hypothetical protein
MTGDPPPRVRRARLRAQALRGRPLPSADAVVERLLAVQAQDPRGMRLAVRARTSGLFASDVDAALDDGRLVVSWLNRGTLHLVAREDWPWLHALTTPQLATGSARRLRQEGVSPAQAERGVAVVRRELDGGPRTRAQLRVALTDAGVPVAGQALVHVLLAAALQGVCVRGPMAGGEQAFVAVGDWLGAPPRVDRDLALGELAVRYLAGHGPARDADLARWAGVTLGDARRGLARISNRLVEVDGGLVELAGRAEPRGAAPPRLLGAFDPLLLGWTSRDDVVGDLRGLVTSNGVFRPFALVEGRAVATWSLVRGRVRLVEPEPLDDGVRADLAEDAADVERYLAG